MEHYGTLEILSTNAQVEVMKHYIRSRRDYELSEIINEIHDTLTPKRPVIV